ncbi:MAG: hypothetical protein EOM74_02300 [Methanomicrobia archaeon]|nr:hypothetical protein [Methanomicrobia archaeon]
MLKFLQVFGQGLLYVVLSPFFLIILAFYVAYTAIVMVFLFFQMIILFFAGKNMFGDLPEDIEAAKILEAHRQAKQAQLNPQPQAQPYPFPPYGFPGYPYPPQPGQVIDQPVVKEIEAKPIDEPIDKKGEEQ